jgi:4'-phosphopantetheinyl transferase
MTNLRSDIDRESPLVPQATADGRLWWAQGGLRLCFLSLAELIERYLPHLDRADYRQQPPIALEAAHLLRDFLAADEMAQVNRFKALKRQVEWIAGRLAVKSLVARWLTPELPPTGIQVVHHPQGAPYLIGAPHIPLSISHAGGYAAAGLLLEPGQTLGLDIEQVKARAVAAIRSTAFSEEERRALPGTDPDPVFRRWCLKEAFLKYIGRGFHENLTRVEILDGTVRHHGQVVPDLTLQVARPFPQHILAVIRGPRRPVDQSPTSNV